ncbi:hypothetical protein J437_LFUL003597 [Ladona fulva]|uniref:PLAT domain-containing protein n=1 Tax=Ladona fulva TaxID=123851 RepID=A0A8K0KK20_LADFU|nr:hypothetical protein J437_LFUL003597 [Ladona fulva]
MVVENPPKLKLVCMKNCGPKVLSNEAFVYKISRYSSEHQKVNMSYSWDMFPGVDNQKKMIDWPNETKGGKNADSLIIFPNTLLQGDEYIFKLVGTTENNLSSELALNLKTVSKLNDGECKVDPIKGTSLLTTFKINCSGFGDLSGDSTVLNYYFYQEYKSHNIEHSLLLHYDTHPIAENLNFVPGLAADNYQTKIFVKVRPLHKEWDSKKVLEKCYDIIKNPELVYSIDDVSDLLSIGISTLEHSITLLSIGELIMRNQSDILYGTIDDWEDDKNVDIIFEDYPDYKELEYEYHLNLKNAQSKRLPIQTCLTIIFLFPSDPNEIIKVILSFKSSWPAGSDEIPMTIIKQASYWIASPISSIFNSSISEEHFPSILKLAHVTPVHKKGSYTNSSMRADRNLVNIVSHESLTVIYYANIYSHLAYGIIFWGNSSAANKAFSAQKRAIKALLNVSSRTPGRPLFQSRMNCRSQCKSLSTQCYKKFISNVEDSVCDNNILLFLEQNYPTDNYVYIVTVNTGAGDGCGTTANVALRLEGTIGLSRIYLLSTPGHKTLTSNSQDWFVLTTPEPLGELLNIRLWHDSTGQKPSWPAHSPYTSCQRLSMAVCVLLSTMLANVMLYGIPEPEPSTQLDEGFFYFTIREWIISIEGALIVFILSAPPFLFFRNSEPGDLEIGKRLVSIIESLRQTFRRKKKEQVFEKGIFIFQPLKVIVWAALDSVVMRHLARKERKWREWSSSSVDIMCLLFYITALYVLAYYTSDPTSWNSSHVFRELLSQSLHNQEEQGPKLNSLTSKADLLDFLNMTVIPTLNARVGYSGEPIQQNEGWTANFPYKLLGAPRLRQIRVKSGLCSIPMEINHVVRDKRCIPSYNYYTEDKADYSIGWEKPDKLANTEGREQKPWIYHTSEETNATIIIGQLNLYPGHGYWTELGRNLKNSRQTFEYLWKSGWFDRHTRAVMIEFSTYSTDCNLFSVVSILIERGPTGIFLPKFQIQTSRLIVQESTEYAINITSYVIFITATILLSYRHCRRYFLSYKTKTMVQTDQPPPEPKTTRPDTKFKRLICVIFLSADQLELKSGTSKWKVLLNFILHPKLDLPTVKPIAVTGKKGLLSPDSSEIPENLTSTPKYPLQPLKYPKLFEIFVVLLTFIILGIHIQQYLAIHKPLENLENGSAFTERHKFFSLFDGLLWDSVFRYILAVDVTIATMALWRALPNFCRLPTKTLSYSAKDPVPNLMKLQKYFALRDIEYSVADFFYEWTQSKIPALKIKAKNKQELNEVVITEDGTNSEACGLPGGGPTASRKSAESSMGEFSKLQKDEFSIDVKKTHFYAMRKLIKSWIKDEDGAELQNMGDNPDKTESKPEQKENIINEKILAMTAFTVSQSKEQNMNNSLHKKYLSLIRYFDDKCKQRVIEKEKLGEIRKRVLQMYYRNQFKENPEYKIDWEGIVGRQHEKRLKNIEGLQSGELRNITPTSMTERSRYNTNTSKQWESKNKNLVFEASSSDKLKKSADEEERETSEIENMKESEKISFQDKNIHISLIGYEKQLTANQLKLNFSKKMKNILEIENMNEEDNKDLNKPECPSDKSLTQYDRGQIKYNLESSKKRKKNRHLEYKEFMKKNDDVQLLNHQNLGDRNSTGNASKKESHEWSNMPTDSNLSAAGMRYVIKEDILDKMTYEEETLNKNSIENIALMLNEELQKIETEKQRILASIKNMTEESRNDKLYHKEAKEKIVEEKLETLADKYEREILSNLKNSEKQEREKLPFPDYLVDEIKNQLEIHKIADDLDKVVEMNKVDDFTIDELDNSQYCRGANAPVSIK